MPFFPEPGERVGLQDLGPQVAVVAGRIPTGEDVVVIGATVPRDDLLDQADTGHFGRFESVGVVLDGLIQEVPGHIQDFFR